jgi:DNA repair protein RecO (recombination protein O)
LNLQPARGFVLGTHNYSESDKIVQLFTLQLGKVKAIAKGVRKPKSRLSSAIDLFTESGFSLYKKPSADLYVLGQAKVVNGHSELKKDFKTITALQVLSEVTVQFLPEAEPHPEIYALVKGALAALGDHPDQQEQFLAGFVLKALDHLGYPLELNVCGECGSSLARRRAVLVPHRGGALCEDCSPSGPSRMKVTPAELEVLKKLRSLPMEKTHVLKLRPAAVREIFLTMLEYVERTIEKKLRMVDYYEKTILNS